MPDCLPHLMRLSALLLLLMCGACSSMEPTGARSGDGVTLKSKADVLFGAASTSTRPATIDMEKVRAATPEWRTIQREAVPQGSARYQLLVEAMRKSIRTRLRTVALAHHVDLVVVRGDIADANGLRVQDLTSATLKDWP